MLLFFLLMMHYIFAPRRNIIRCRLVNARMVVFMRNFSLYANHLMTLHWSICLRALYELWIIKLCTHELAH